RQGQLQQAGPPDEVYTDPATIFVAAFLGPGQTSLLQSAIYAQADGGVIIDLGTQVVRLPAGDPSVAGLTRYHNARVTFGIRAEALTLVDTGAAGERADLLRGVVRMVEDLGHETIVHVDTGAVPAAHATTRLDLPEPDRGLTELFADQPETV